MRLNTLQRAVGGLFIKRLIDLCFLLKIKPGKLADDNNIVVSLTSYGRRVKASVPYTIYWFFKQKVKPSKIVLWLDEDNWNDDNIPLKLRFLSRYGLEIRFCKDIKSYKKLVYSLQLYPDNSIVTLDDDLLYYRGLLSGLLDKAQANPGSIIAMRHHQPAWKTKGQEFLSYRKWRTASEEMKKIPCMPTTGGGTLFPPHCFNNEALNEDEKIIIKLIKIDPRISQESISEKSGFSRSKVQRIMKKLLVHGYLQQDKDCWHRKGYVLSYRCVLPESA